MNIFSNIGITELIVILLLALLVVGPERLPELARKLGKTLRDLRQAYENLTRDLGPELAAIQKTTQELRESVDSVTSIPRDAVQSVVKAADLDDTVKELKDVQRSIGQVGQTLSSAGKVVKDPVGAAVSAARQTLAPPKAPPQEKTLDEQPTETEDATPQAAEARLDPSPPEETPEGPAEAPPDEPGAEAGQPPEERLDE